MAATVMIRGLDLAWKLAVAIYALGYIQGKQDAQAERENNHEHE